MPRVTFVDVAGQARTIEVEEGSSLMEAAVNNGIDGVIGECGGACACATCHVYIDAPWSASAGTPSSGERAMLDCVELVEPGSRLGCQVKVTAGLDGIVVRLPAHQD